MKRDNLERSPKIYLSEIIEFIDKIEKYTKGMSYDDFSKDTRTVDAVDANLRMLVKLFVCCRNTEG